MKNLLARGPGTKESLPFEGILGLLLVLILIPNSDAAPCGIGGCGGPGDWDGSAQAFLNTDIPNSFIQSNVQKAVYSGETKAQANSVPPASRSDKFANGKSLKSLQAVSSSDVVIDASSGDEYAKRPHIKGAIHLPSKSFLYENGTLRPDSELGRILGEDGISRDDRVVIYGNSTASGDATFIFWVMRYLGHDDVSVLDGSLDDWIEASQPLESESRSRRPTIYQVNARSKLLAGYDYVKGGRFQMVDARAFQEFGKKRIPGSISIDPQHVLDDGRIKDPAGLNDTFLGLDKDKPVVVYSNDGFNASVVWFALQLMGYDSRLYTWRDWMAHQLAEVEVKANEMVRYKKLGR